MLKAYWESWASHDTFVCSAYSLALVAIRHAKLRREVLRLLEREQPREHAEAVERLLPLELRRSTLALLRQAIELAEPIRDRETADQFYRHAFFEIWAKPYYSSRWSSPEEVPNWLAIPC